MRPSVFRSPSIRFMPLLAFFATSLMVALPARASPGHTEGTGTATRLRFTGQPLAARVDTSFEPDIEVQVQDSDGQRVLDYSGDVTLSLKPETGSSSAVLQGTLSIAVVDGYATFPGLSIDTGGVQYVLIATSPGLTSAESVPIQITTPIVRVAPDGNDRNDGSAWDRPKKTLSAAVLQVDRDNGSVWLAKGSYPDSVLVDLPDTMTGAFAIFGGFQGSEASPDERTAGPRDTLLNGLQIWRASVILDTLYAASIEAWAGGSLSLNHGEAVTLTANTRSSASATDSVIDSVVCIDAVVGLSACRLSSAYAYEGGIYAERTLIKGAGIELPVMGRASLESCVVTGNGTGVTMGTLSSLTLENSTVAGNGTGVLETGNNSSVLCVNSVVAYNGRGIAFEGDEAPGELAVRASCLFENLEGNFVNISPNLGAGIIEADPLFLDRAAGDFRLRSGSPCIDAGDDTVVKGYELDFAGRPRLQGAHADIGAYESPVMAPFTVADVSLALRIGAGFIDDREAWSRLNVEADGDPEPRVDLWDACRIARKAAGLETNP